MIARANLLIIFPNKMKSLSITIVFFIINSRHDIVHGNGGFSGQVEDFMGTLRDAVKTIGSFVGDDKKGCKFECPYGKSMIIVLLWQPVS